MTREDKRAIIERLVTILRRLRDHGNTLYSLIGYDGKFTEAVHAVEQEAINAVALAVGDKCGWIDWFIHENDFGARGFEAMRAEWAEMRPIRTVSDLLDLMEDAP